MKSLSWRCLFQAISQRPPVKKRFRQWIGPWRRVGGELIFAAFLWMCAGQRRDYRSIVSVSTLQELFFCAFHILCIFPNSPAQKEREVWAAQQFLRDYTAAGTFIWISRIDIQRTWRLVLVFAFLNRFLICNLQSFLYHKDMKKWRTIKSRKWASAVSNFGISLWLANDYKDLAGSYN